MSTATHLLSAPIGRAPGCSETRGPGTPPTGPLRMPRRHERRGALWWLCGYVIWFATSCTTVARPGPLLRADVIVVLGNRPPVDARGRIRPETVRRVQMGVTLFRQGLAPYLVMTGGTDGSHPPEADVMRTYARDLAVPEEAIWIEPESADTITNARNTIRLLRQRIGGPFSVILVSSPSHLPRARTLFECGGLPVQTAPTPPPPSAMDALGWSIYEGMVRFLYLFVDECAEIGTPN